MKIVNSVTIIVSLSPTDFDNNDINQLHTAAIISNF